MALVTQFLSGVRELVMAQNGRDLADWLKVEPNKAGPAYLQLAQELKSSFTSTGSGLETLVDNCLPEEDDLSDGKGSPWPGFNSFIKDYLEYWRDTDFNDMAIIYTQLSDLLNSCANAFANPSFGIMMLETSMRLSQSLSNLVMHLNRRPELLEGFKTYTSAEEGQEKKSFVELVADIIQKFFTACLSDRSSTRWTQPKGKKVAVYMFANTTLKLLFACDKARLAIQMLTNLSTQGPALSLYPASQRVAFLYYVGRFNFHHGHFLRAHLCLQAAYVQCPPQFLSHRRKIVEYLIPSNLLCGRFPNQILLDRPEAVGLVEVYFPIRAAIRSGSFIAFRDAMDHAHSYLWDKKIYLPLLALKTLVWRSFTRKVFLVSSQLHALSNSLDDESQKTPPLLDFQHLLAAACYVQKLLEGYIPQPPASYARAPHTNTIFLRPVTNTPSDDSNADSHPCATLEPPPGGRKFLRPAEGLFFGNLRPSMALIEGAVAALLYAGFLNGFIHHAQKKFVIEGAKRMNPAVAGWPNAYQSIVERLREGPDDGGDGAHAEYPNLGAIDEVPGWVRDQGYQAEGGVVSCLN